MITRHLDYFFPHQCSLDATLCLQFDFLAVTLLEKHLSGCVVKCPYLIFTLKQYCLILWWSAGKWQTFVYLWLFLTNAILLYFKDVSPLIFWHVWFLAVGLLPYLSFSSICDMFFFFSDLFLKNLFCIFERRIYNVGDVENDHLCADSGLGQNGTRSFFKICHVSPGARVLRPSSSAFPGELVGLWIGVGKDVSQCRYGMLASLVVALSIHYSAGLLSEYF